MLLFIVKRSGGEASGGGRTGLVEKRGFGLEDPAIFRFPEGMR
jgi:hypothetical protein